MKELPALFIGRFQPFHLGHLDALKQIFEKEREVIIVIGSAENDLVEENPFTASERYQMIEAALTTEKIGGEIVKRDQWAIIPVRDINNHALWVSHVVRLIPPFGNVYSGSPTVSRLFKEAGHGTIVSITLREKISGTEVRRRMKENNSWEEYVPASVAEFIKRNGARRIKEIKSS